MPLVKDGKIAADLFVHVPDGGELPGDGAILVPAARFLEDPEAILKRAGKLGVIWPNNRDIDDLAIPRPACGRRAGVVARDAAPTAGPVLRGVGTGELRHRPGAARSVRVHAAPARALRKDSDAAALQPQRSGVLLSRPAMAASPRSIGGWLRHSSAASTIIHTASPLSRDLHSAQFLPPCDASPALSRTALAVGRMLPVSRSAPIGAPLG
jgi:hypothetical protein